MQAMPLKTWRLFPIPICRGSILPLGVMMFNILAGADPWAGAWSDANGNMEFTEDMHHMEMMVWKEYHQQLRTEG